MANWDAALQRFGSIFLITLGASALFGLWAGVLAFEAAFLLDAIVNSASRRRQ